MKKRKSLVDVFEKEPVNPAAQEFLWNLSSAWALTNDETMDILFYTVGKIYNAFSLELKKNLDLEKMSVGDHMLLNRKAMKEVEALFSGTPVMALPQIKEKFSEFFYSRAREIALQEPPKFEHASKSGVLNVPVAFHAIKSLDKMSLQ